MVQEERQVHLSKDLVCKQVTVYTDRAEVKRLIQTTLKEGRNEVVVKDLPRSIDKDSVRVEGKGDAIVLEVNFASQPIKQDEQGENKLKQLQDQLKELQIKQNQIKQKQVRINQQREVLNKVTQNLGTSVSPSEKSSGLLLGASTDDLEKWLLYFDSRAESLDERSEEVEIEKKNVDQAVEVVVRKINELGFCGGIEHHSREVSILLESSKGGEVELEFTYLVHGVCWRPSYDVRVFGKDKKMKVNYYGKIEQKSGEDWKDTKIILSTAVPGIAGNIPWLPTLNVSAHKHVEKKAMKMKSMHRESQRRRNGAAGFSSNGGGHGLFGAAPQMEMMADEGMSYESEQQSLTVAQSEVADSGLTTTFEIAQETTIPSDTTDHKVTVGLLELHPELHHVSVPSKTQIAYLKATARNNTAYPMLPGPVSVFMDNNFVAKTTMKSVGVKEKFSVSLGADPAVKVEYKPEKKYAGEAGFLSKAIGTVIEHKIVLKNTRPEVVHIKMILQVPRPSNDRVKVTLMEPEDRHKGVLLTKESLLEWDMDLPAGGESTTVTFKYKVDHPSEDDVTYSENHGPGIFGI